MPASQKISFSQISTTGSSNGNVLISNGSSVSWGSVSSANGPFFLDDISGYFDGANTRFTLSYNNGTQVTPSSPYQVSLFVGNVPVTPSNYLYDYFNLPEVSVFNSGFRVTGNTVIFATAPTRGMGFSGTFINSSAQTFSFKQTPFTALSIMLGP